MSDESKIKQMNKNGILIHQLPAENVEEVMDCFPSACILNYFHNDVGLHIYFHNADRVVQCALDRVIEVRGQLFNIYLTVTNLTVHGVASCTRDVKSLMESNGYEDIVDAYHVEELEEHEGHKSFKILSDYRVILNVPEIFANYNLTPVRWPERHSYAFRVTFFCRLCRQNDHKAFQCPKSFKMDSATSYYVHRIPHESNYSSLNTFKMRQFKLQSATSYGNDPRIPSSSPSCSTSGPSQSSLFKSHPQSMKIEVHLTTEDDDIEDTGEAPESPSERDIPQSSIQRRLCEGIEEAVSKTTGVLLPGVLVQFLNQVRRRKTKKLMEITFKFTTRISDLIQQLELVEKNYYVHVESRSRSDEDRDLNFLKFLRKRLQDQINIREQEANFSED